MSSVGRKGEGMKDHYILEGHNTKAVDLMTWAKWFEKTERHVADDKVGDVRISTVFLGLDHSFCGAEPLLFETLVFGGSLDGEMERYSTWDEAEAGHKQMVKRIAE
jgi:hypothetical protein